MKIAIGISLVAICLATVPITDVALVRQRLVAARASVLAATSLQYLPGLITVSPLFGHGIRAVSDRPLFWPLGTWAMADDGRVFWITNADIDRLKRLD